MSQEEIESLFFGPLSVRPDVLHSVAEERFQAIGKGLRDRFIFLVFTLGERNGQTYVRPISARSMHRREIEGYEEADSGV